MSNLNLLIVDDEPNAVRGLVQILKSQKDVCIVGTASSGVEAVELIESLRPQVVLLDIQMPGMSGFDVVSKIGKQAMPCLVFVTAHEEFALQAFEVHAFDYILKPVDDVRLFAALDRIRKRIFNDQPRLLERQLKALLTTISAGEDTRIESPKKLSIKSQGNVVFVSIDQISHIESAGNYVRYFIDGDCYLCRATISEVQKQLDATSLVRIHRSKIVNADRIRKICCNPGGEYLITLDNDLTITTGPSYRNQVRELING